MFPASRRTDSMDYGQCNALDLCRIKDNSSLSKISKGVFLLLILITNIQWTGPRDSKVGKGVG